jgi:hypothetical protein
VGDAAVTVRTFADGADDWMDHGACRDNPDVDPDWFFAQSHREIDLAKQVCAGCGHVAACHAYAVAHSEVGVWGGTDDRDRAKARRSARPLQATCRNGHRMTPDNVHYRADGGRRCKECWRAYWRLRRSSEKNGLQLVRGGQP